MKFSTQWLRSFVDYELSDRELAHTLTMAGIEVEDFQPVAPPFNNIVVAEVLSVDKHPNADRLSVCQVNTGREQIQIVCGAQNVAVGIKVPCATIGARLPNLEIKPVSMRGVESKGMLCSASELGLAQQSDGLMLLGSEAPVGADFREYYELDDSVFTLKLTPNRGDCLSVYGIARELSAITAARLKETGITEVAPEISDKLNIEVVAPTACPLYCGRIIHQVNTRAPTPLWMKQRLERSGLRSISAVVDITNYVLLELGQPLHAFDLAKVNEAIQVRFAKSDETLRLLNEETITLAQDMLVIADRNGPIALAGIMGGAPSAVGDQTTDIFLESAFFAPDAIMGKSRRLNISTDSSYRFERGVDFGNTKTAMERATQLILEICGGKPGPVIEVINNLPKRGVVSLRPARVQRTLGIALGNAEIERILERLEFSYSRDNDMYIVTPPTYRFDIVIEEDLIEELARIHGYDNIPAQVPVSALRMLPCSETGRDVYSIKEELAARDYQEIISFSFIDETWERDFAANETAIRLKNPIASQMNTMRSTLIGSLINCLRFNLNRKQQRVRIFEVGRCFSNVGKELAQPEKLGGLCYGNALSEQWGSEARTVDFFDVKSDIEALIAPRIARFEAATHPALHPGRSARIKLDEQVIGWLGELHPQWRLKYDLPLAPVVFELDVGPLLQQVLPQFVEIPKFPAVQRDLAVVMSDRINVQALLDAMYRDRPEIVSEIRLFDMYQGKGIENGKKSLAFRVVLQDTQKTLTDVEVDAALAKLLQILEHQYNAKLR